MAKVISKKAKVYEVIVTMTVKKRYTVKADSEAEAETKLAESGIVTVVPENDRKESYDEQYEVIGVTSGKVDVD